MNPNRLALIAVLLLPSITAHDAGAQTRQQRVDQAARIKSDPAADAAAAATEAQAAADAAAAAGETKMRLPRLGPLPQRPMPLLRRQLQRILMKMVGTSR